jgi:hypothetical protein
VGRRDGDWVQEERRVYFPKHMREGNEILFI